MRQFLLLVAAATMVPALSYAQAAPVNDPGAPPPDAKALVAAPKDVKDAPKIKAPSNDTTNATASAGGMLSTGNTKTQALTLNSLLDMRRGNNGFGASLLGNYGRSKLAGDEQARTTAENFQARLRYDRFITEQFAVFGMITERYDRFQGLASRTNFDPGVKYIFWKPEHSALWGELGYDLQHDIRTGSGRRQLDDDGNKRTDVPLLSKTLTDHSTRVYVGFRHAFNKEVTFSTGLEYLQSLVNTDLAKKNSRLNFDASLAAKLYGGLALGIGFTGRFDNNPLPGRAHLDTATTLSVIYAFSAPEPKEDAPKCPACPEIPPCPNAAPPPPADPTIPSGTTPVGITPPAVAPAGTPTPTTTTPPAAGTTPPADTTLR